ncbi:MAG: DUF4396 domain-containing protein [Actinomycetota bacterium]|nr:DUF4396 domain-containing protein [Actinomycetota bacterium]
MRRLVNPLFWVSMSLALALAYVAAFPVNRYLLTRERARPDSSVPPRRS